MSYHYQLLPPIHIYDHVQKYWPDLVATAERIDKFGPLDRGRISALLYKNKDEGYLLRAWESIDTFTLGEHNKIIRTTKRLEQNKLFFIQGDVRLIEIPTGPHVDYNTSIVPESVVQLWNSETWSDRINSTEQNNNEREPNQEHQQSPIEVLETSSSNSTNTSNNAEAVGHPRISTDFPKRSRIRIGNPSLN